MKKIIANRQVEISLVKNGTENTKNDCINPNANNCNDYNLARLTTPIKTTPIKTMNTKNSPLLDSKLNTQLAPAKHLHLLQEEAKPPSKSPYLPPMSTKPTQHRLNYTTTKKNAVRSIQKMKRSKRLKPEPHPPLLFEETSKLINTKTYNTSNDEDPFTDSSTFTDDETTTAQLDSTTEMSDWRNAATTTTISTTETPPQQVTSPLILFTERERDTERDTDERDTDSSTFTDDESAYEIACESYSVDHSSTSINRLHGCESIVSKNRRKKKKERKKLEKRVSITIQEEEEDMIDFPGFEETSDNDTLNLDSIDLDHLSQYTLDNSNEQTNTEKDEEAEVPTVPIKSNRFRMKMVAGFVRDQIHDERKQKKQQQQKRSRPRPPPPPRPPRFLNVVQMAPSQNINSTMTETKETQRTLEAEKESIKVNFHQACIEEQWYQEELETEIEINLDSLLNNATALEQMEEETVEDLEDEIEYLCKRSCHWCEKHTPKWLRLLLICILFFIVLSLGISLGIETSRQAEMRHEQEKAMEQAMNVAPSSFESTSMVSATATEEEPKEGEEKKKEEKDDDVNDGSNDNGSIDDSDSDKTGGTTTTTGGTTTAVVPSPVFSTISNVYVPSPSYSSLVSTPSSSFAVIDTTAPSLAPTSVPVINRKSSVPSSSVTPSFVRFSTKPQSITFSLLSWNSLISNDDLQTDAVMNGIEVKLASAMGIHSQYVTVNGIYLCPVDVRCFRRRRRLLNAKEVLQYIVIEYTVTSNDASVVEQAELKIQDEDQFRTAISQGTSATLSKELNVGSIQVVASSSIEMNSPSSALSSTVRLIPSPSPLSTTTSSTTSSTTPATTPAIISTNTPSTAPSNTPSNTPATTPATTPAPTREEKENEKTEPSSSSNNENNDVNDANDNVDDNVDNNVDDNVDDNGNQGIDGGENYIPSPSIISKTPSSSRSKVLLPEIDLLSQAQVPSPSPSSEAEEKRNGISIGTAIEPSSSSLSSLSIVVQVPSLSPLPATIPSPIPEKETTTGEKEIFNTNTPSSFSDKNGEEKDDSGEAISPSTKISTVTTSIVPSSSLTVVEEIPSPSPLATVTTKTTPAPIQEDDKEEKEENYDIILGPSSSRNDEEKNRDDSDATKDTTTAAAPSPVVKLETPSSYVPSPSLSYPSLLSTPSSSLAAVHSTSASENDSETKVPSPSPSIISTPSSSHSKSLSSETATNPSSSIDSISQAQIPSPSESEKNRAPSMSTETTSDTAIEPSSSPLSVAARVPSSSPLPATEETTKETTEETIEETTDKENKEEKEEKKKIILAPSSSHHNDKKENQDDSDATKDTITAAAPSPVIVSFLYVPSPSSYPSLPSTPSSSSAAVQTTSIPTSFPSPSPETEEENKGSVSPSTILSPAPAPVPTSSGTSNRPSGGLNSTTPGSSSANDNEEEKDGSLTPSSSFAVIKTTAPSPVVPVLTSPSSSKEEEEEENESIESNSSPSPAPKLFIVKKKIEIKQTLKIPTGGNLNASTVTEDDILNIRKAIAKTLGLPLSAIVINSIRDSNRRRLHSGNDIKYVKNSQSLRGIRRRQLGNGGLSIDFAVIIWIETNDDQEEMKNVTGIVEQKMNKIANVNNGGDASTSTNGKDVTGTNFLKDMVSDLTGVPINEIVLETTTPTTTVETVEVSVSVLEAPSATPSSSPSSTPPSTPSSTPSPSSTTSSTPLSTLSSTPSSFSNVLHGSPTPSTRSPGTNSADNDADKSQNSIHPSPSIVVNEKLSAPSSSKVSKTMTEADNDVDNSQKSIPSPSVVVDERILVPSPSSISSPSSSHVHISTKDVTGSDINDGVNGVPSPFTGSSGTTTPSSTVQTTPSPTIINTPSSSS